MVSAAIEEWVWRSHAVVAAALAPDGTIRRPNPALQRLAARELAGVPLAALIEPSQHPALTRRLAAAGEQLAAGRVRLPLRPRPAVGRPAAVARALRPTRCW